MKAEKIIDMYHLNVRLHENALYNIFESRASTANVFGDMRSMVGAIATWRFSAIRAKSGSNQPELHSQWASRNMTVGA